MRMWRACAITTAPRAEIRTVRLSRSNSRTPSWRSTSATCALSDGCDTWQACAARRNPRRSATATTYWSWRRETFGRTAIVTYYQYHIIDILDVSHQVATTSNRSMFIHFAVRQETPMSEKPRLTTESGAPVADNQNSQTAGPGGPTLMQDQ